MTVQAPAPPDLLSAAHVADPWPGYRVLRDHYPVHFDEAMQSWLISRYEDARTISRSFEPGAMGQEMLGQYIADTVLFAAQEGQDHRRVRQLLAPVFARQGVETFRHHFERHAHALLDPIFERERRAIASGERERAEMDFVKEFTNRFSLNVISEIMGFQDVDVERVEGWFRAWAAQEGNLYGDPEITERALRSKDEYGEFIYPVIAERRNGDGNDLVTRLCQADADGFSLSDEEVRSTVGAMYLGGGETTDHQIGWIMYELATKPELQRELAENPDLMNNVLAESMRYHAIVQYVSRVAPRDVEVGGVTIEAGTPMALLFASGNRDPRRWQNPDEFDVHRPDLDASKSFTGAAEHLGFGSGAHFCIGSHITKAEMEIALEVFFEQAHDVRLADGFEPQADPEAVFIRRLSGLQISFDL